LDAPQTGPALDRCGRCPRTRPLASSGPPVYITLNTYIKPGLAHEATSSQSSGLCGSGVIRPRGPESCAFIRAFSVLESIPRPPPLPVPGFLRIRSVDQATDDGSWTTDPIHAHAAVPHSSVPAPAACRAGAPPAACPPAGLPCACAQRAASGLSAVYATTPRPVYAVPAALRSTIEGVISNPNQSLIPICVSNYIRKFDSILIIDNCRINISTSITCRLIELESIYPVVKKGEKGNI
jgi:hypothetical protein